MPIIFVAIGGALGALSRFGITELFGKLEIEKRDGFPWATLAANLIGCFLIGVAMAYIGKHLSDENGRLAQTLVVTGFLGGLTTFSTFAFQTNGLMLNSEMLYALLNIVANVVGGILLVKAGSALVSGAQR